MSSVETLKEVIRVKFRENGETFYKKYNAKDVVVIKDSNKKDQDKIEVENEEDLKELEKLERLDKEENENHKNT